MWCRHTIGKRTSCIKQKYSKEGLQRNRKETADYFTVQYLKS